MPISLRNAAEAKREASGLPGAGLRKLHVRRRREFPFVCTHSDQGRSQLWGYSGVSGHPVYENGSFFIGAIAAPTNVDKVEATFKEELAKALKEGFSEEEIAAAKKGWAQDRAISRSEDRSLASTLADNEYEGRTMAFQKELDEKISALTGQQIVEAMRRHIDPAKLSYVKAGDFIEGEDGDTVAGRSSAAV